MEQIIRPFQSVGILKTKKLKTSITTADDTAAHLCWGDVGEVPDAVEQDDDFDGLNFRTEECHEDLREQTRKTEDIRVEVQEDTEIPYVMVQRIRQVDFKKNTKKELLVQYREPTVQFGDVDIFAGSPFTGLAKKFDACKSRYYLNR